MQRFCLRRLMLLSGIALLMLVSCSDESNGNPLSQSPELNVVDVSSTEQPDPQQPTTTSTGNLLSPAQIEKLTQLPIPIVAPTYLPEGFRVVSADGESVKYANGDDDAGYLIRYEGEDGTCFVIYSAKGGPRGLKQIGQVESAVGAVKIYEETYEGSTSVQSFIPVEGNPVMISPMSQLNSATGSYERCPALERTEYERILRSIEVVK